MIDGNLAMSNKFENASEPDETQSDISTKYPIYRKYKNGMEFHKLISDTETVSVYKSNYGYIIMLSYNCITRGFVEGYGVAMPSNRDEFEKAYVEAHWAFTQANKLQ